MVLRMPQGHLEMIHIRPKRKKYHLYYNVVANPWFWFGQHEMYPTEGSPPPLEEIERAWDKGYVKVNTEFAQAIVEAIDDPSTQPVVMLQDYHLYCAPWWIRKASPDAVITQFIHIPWPTPDVWQRFVPAPILKDLITGLVSNDIVGFQTEKDRNNFLDTCVAVLGGKQLSDDTGVKVFGHTVLARTYPISIDVEERRSLLGTPEFAFERGALEYRYPDDHRVLLSVGRGDYSKNHLRTLRAFAKVLTDHPELAGTARFEIIANPTRGKIPEYLELKERINALVRQINDLHGSRRDPHHLPVTLKWVGENMHRAAAAMARADVIAVTSLADGMNLTAKDAVTLNQRNGTLVLTKTCGAHDELGADAVSITDPRDVREIAGAIYQALTMSPEERWARLSRLKTQIVKNSITEWEANQRVDIQALRVERQASASQPARRQTAASGVKAALAM